MKNREIKFRAYFGGIMYYSDSQESAKLLNIPLGKSIIGGFMAAFTFDETLGQFTGLHDKNGKEIYEGDICKSDENDLDAFIVNEPKWFRCDAFDCYGYDELSGFFYDNFEEPDGSRIMNDIEIIGNIYQHPELLK
jgi:uncharacterized phage protein (TIGR01671 family)